MTCRDVAMEKMVTPRTVHMLLGKSLPEVQHGHQRHCPLAGCLREQRFQVASMVKQSSKKTSVYQWQI